MVGFSFSIVTSWTALSGVLIIGTEAGGPPVMIFSWVGICVVTLAVAYSMAEMYVDKTCVYGYGIKLNQSYRCSALIFRHVSLWNSCQRKQEQSGLFQQAFAGRMAASRV